MKFDQNLKLRKMFKIFHNPQSDSDYEISQIEKYKS